jgi:iron complex outermembrane receptor protein
MPTSKVMLLSLLFLVFSYSSVAQCSLQISGTVMDKHHREKLSFALIEIKELRLKVVADSLGNFLFTDLCKGSYTLKCSHFDCDTLYMTIELSKNEFIEFNPEHHAEILDELGVFGRLNNDNKTKPKQELKGLDFEKIKGKSLGQAIKNLTGVNLLQTGPTIAKPVIHGLHSNRVLILNNGVRQEGQQWGNEHAPEVDPFIANQLTVIKGANAVRYGSDAMGGVILVEAPALPDSGKFNGEVNALGFSNGKGAALSAMLEQNFKKKKWEAISWRAQGTLKRQGTIHAPDYILANTGNEEYNFSYAIGIRKRIFEAEVFYSQFNTNIGIFTGSHIGNVTDLLNVIASQKPAVTSGFTYKIDRPYQHIEHELFKVKARLSTGLKGNFHIMYARQYNLRQEYDKDMPYNDSLAALNLPDLNFTLTTHLTEMYWEHVNINGFTGKVGISANTQGNTYRGRFFIPNFRNYSAGAFIIERLVKKTYELEFGLRYDFKNMQVYMYEQNLLIEPEHQFNRLSANFGLLWYSGVHSRLMVNLATAWRAPGINELYSDGLHHGSATVERGDNELKEETSYNLMVNWQHNGHSVFFEIEPYLNYFNQYINLIPVQPPTVTIKGAFPTYVFTQTNALFRGVDAQLRLMLLEHLTFTTKASILRATDLVQNNWLFGVPSDRFTQSISWNFKKGKKLKESFAGMNAMYVNKQFRVPFGIDYMASPSGYFLLGCEAGTTLTWNKQQLLIGLEVTNLLNENYRDFMNRFRYFADEMGTNLTIRLTYKF